MLRHLYRKLRKNILHHLIPVSRAEIFAAGREAVEVVGFFHSASGIGESARLCALQLKKMGVKVRCTSVEKMFGKPLETEWSFDDTVAADEIGCRIIHLNPPMMPPVAIKMGLRNFSRVYNIGYWAWELEKIPAEWVHAVRYVNAVFCPSEFTSQTIRKYTDKPVETVPHPVAVGPLRAGMRAHLKLSDQAFVVSSLFSFGSALERKNPYAAVTAFAAAFGKTDDAWLILKSNHGGNSGEKKQFLDFIKPYPQIRLIDDIWEKEEVLGLIKASDIYLSLHRSEGFGLPIAEAMLLGTPTVVTDWSGSRDFCNGSNSFPVSFTLIPVKSRHPEFAELDQVKWADPDSAAAAGMLKKIYLEREIARAKAELCLRESNGYFSEPRYIHALNKLKQGACLSERAQGVLAGGTD
jgi:glycosyltransferase involved in cell wall biosynthesis